jgi:hypothetical protein
VKAIQEPTNAYDKALYLMPTPLSKCVTAIKNPFQRQRPFLFIPDIAPAILSPGIYRIRRGSPAFSSVEALTAIGASWGRPNPRCESPVIRPTTGFDLVDVDVVITSKHISESFAVNFEPTHQGFHINDPKRAEVLKVLSFIMGAGNILYAFHGPRIEDLNSICNAGLGVTSKTDGRFGTGVYTTLNMEYAIKYSFGEFDPPGQKRLSTKDSCCPVVMFACALGQVYPIIPSDFKKNCVDSEFRGKPVTPGFDAHVVCVNNECGYQEVPQERCQYVKIVTGQTDRLLPLAVLWFKKSG